MTDSRTGCSTLPQPHEGQLQKGQNAAIRGWAIWQIETVAQIDRPNSGCHMTALRCTAKLLKAMKVAPTADPAPAQNRLGGWTANLVRVSRIQLVLAVNDATRFGVVVDAAPYAHIPFRLIERIFKALLFIGVPADQAAEEAEAMRPIEFAASNSKSVLGTLNQYALDIDSGLRDGQAHSAAELTARLADNVVLKPSHIGFPADRVREAFELPPIVHSQFPMSS